MTLGGLMSPAAVFQRKYNLIVGSNRLDRQTNGYASFRREDN